MKSKVSLFQNKWKLKYNQIKDYSKEFYDYRSPLLVYAFVVLIVGILDRWMLQKYSGSVEQGFYGLSYQIGVVCFLFTSAMTPLITREFAIAFEKSDRIEMTRLFSRYIPMLYSIAAYFACFIAVEAEKVTLIMGGDNFHKATIAVTIMSFYPIHQTYGQLSGSVFYATGQTRLYRNIGIFTTIFGLPLSYFLIAPLDKMGLDAGAIGLACKMVIIQIFGVNIQLYFNAKFLGLKFWWYICHQIGCVGCLLGAAVAAKICIDHILPFHDNSVVISFILNGIFYSLIVLLIFYLKPSIFGLNKKDVKYLLQQTIGKVR